MQVIMRMQRLSNLCHRRGLGPVSRAIDLMVRLVFSAALPGRARIGEGVFVHHSGLGLVVNGASEIGPGCEIGVHVVLGGDGRGAGAPRVGAGAVVLAGARLLGPVEIGPGAVIAANAVVVSDVPARALAAGQPARILRREIDTQGYRHRPGGGDVSRAKHVAARDGAWESAGGSSSGGIEPPLGAGRRARPVVPGPEGPPGPDAAVEAGGMPPP